MAVNNVDGSEVFTQKITYSDRKTSKEQFINAGSTWWSKEKANFFLVPIFSTMDGLVLYSIFDDCLTQSAFMGLIMAAGVALILNIIPVIIAYFLHIMLDKTQRYANVLFIVLLSGFILLYACTVYLRFSYSANYNKQASTGLENTVTDENEEISEGESGEGGGAVVLLLSVSPLITSMLGFAIAYVSNDPNKKKLDRLEIESIEIDTKIEEVKTAITQLECVIENGIQVDLDNDKRALDDAINEIIVLRPYLKAKARLNLAEYLANPDATSRITKEMIADESEFITDRDNEADHMQENSVINMDMLDQVS